MTFEANDKRDILGAFLKGASIMTIAQLYACSYATVEAVIREGTHQAMAQLAAQPDDPVEVAAKVN